jgi:pimeloyl-ACP methyl ester carboxylesterase
MDGQIVFEGKPIHFSVTGSGKSLVFLHGFTESADIWDDFMHALSNDYQSVAIDLPGHGRSAVYGELHTMEFMAEAVKAVLDYLKVNECILIGHSMGGYVTMAFSRLYPLMLRGIVLFHSHAAADSPEARENRERTIRLVRADHHDFLSQFIPDQFAAGQVMRHQHHIDMLQRRASALLPQSIIASLEGMKRRSGYLDTLKELPAPVFFILGKQDSRIPYQTVLEQAALPAHAEILLMDNVGHMGFLEARDSTLLAIKGFADRFA